jgi:hypothetical protein
METKRTNSVAAELPLFSVEVGGTAVATSLVHPETRQAITAVAMDHSAAVVGSPDMDLVVSVCERALGNGRRVTVVNEGLTPTLTYQGRTFTGQPGGMILEAKDLPTLVQLDGERGALLLKAREHGHEVIGENDKEIIDCLSVQYGVSHEDISAYLLFRQVTNYFFIDVDKRPELYEYIRANVVERYAEMLGSEAFMLSLEDAFTLTHASLTTANIGWQNETAVMNYFLEQSTIRPVMAQLQKDELPLSGTQRVALLYNMLRDERFAGLVLENWGQAETPDKLTVLGLPHVDATLEEAERRGIISKDQYAKYEKTVRDLGRTVFRWSPILESQTFLSS